MEISDKNTTEYQKCKDDIIYFAENYISVNNGTEKFELYPYQIHLLEYINRKYIT